MRIIVTGGAGFIGSHLCENLLLAGHQIWIIDELNDFYSPALKRANLQSVRAVGAVRFSKINICDVDAVEHIFAEFCPDAVVHLAARAGVRPSLEQPLLYEHVNVRGTMILLEASRRHGTQKFVFASSSSVYGIANTVPFRVDDHVNMPISPYAATKIAGEKIAFTYSHLYGLNVSCLRFFTVYGPRQRPDLAIRKFTTMIWNGEPIPVFGDGSTGRDYTYIDDITEGIIGAIHSDHTYGVFNLGNSSPVDLNTMIRTIEETLGMQAVIKRLPDQPGDVPITYADICESERVLGYRPKISFPEGIRKFVQWFLAVEARRLSVAAQK
jgi:UDP-glucuronate 4-epimerase